MNRHLKRMLAAGCCALIVFVSSIRLFLPLRASAYDAACETLAGEILDRETGGDLQNWLDNVLPGRVGQSSADWYAMAAVQHGYDLSAYGTALHSYLNELDEPSATSRERLALTLTACDASAAQETICTDILDGSAGKMGIMSWIFALHLMNNGVQSAQFTQEQLIRELTGKQAPDGGWSLAGDFGDPDVTAMTLQALAPYRDSALASDAVTRGISYLSDAQLDSGAYRSFGTENPESTAQVWIALCALDIDPLADNRFLKNGNSLLDGIRQFRLSSGSYAHTVGGIESVLATVQTYLALTAAELQKNGQGSLLIFHASEPFLPDPMPAAEPQQTEPERVSAQTEPVAGVTSSATDLTNAAAQTEVQTTASSLLTSASTAAVTTMRTESAIAETARTTVPPQDMRTAREKYPYRIPLTAAVWGGGAILAVIFLLRKKRSAKTYLTLAGGCIILTGLVWFIKIESPEQYYQSELKTGGGTVTMAIRCDVICGLPGSEQYPADGIIMPLTEFSIAPEESALDLLYDAVKAYTLQIEVDGVSGDTVETAYVRGIASLYEFDFGDLSGWTYTVNGVRPSVGSGACKLHDGDCVIWEYTVNL